MAVSKAQQMATAKYVKNNYDRIELKVPKGKKDVLQRIVEGQSESLNSYTKKALQAKIKADTGNEIEL